MEKKNYLNLGCGKRFHKAWTNLDMVSFDPRHVQEANILKGIPYPDNSFDLVYHSHLFEHLPTEQAEHFLRECHRVLRPGGVIRIVLPDFEELTRLYLQLLEENLQNPSPESIANYQWVAIEMYDQAVRQVSGGEMLKYLAQDPLPNEDFVVQRIGSIATDFRKKLKNPEKLSFGQKLQKFWKLSPRIKFRMLMDRWVLLFLFGQARRNYKAGMLKLSGEVHNWFYDRFSLGLLLQKTGFHHIQQQSAFKSYIPEWNDYQLDGLIENGEVFKRGSLFMEAKKA